MVHYCDKNGSEMKYLSLLVALGLTSSTASALHIEGFHEYEIEGGTCKTTFYYDFSTLDGRQGPHFERAVKTCEEKYGPRSPCLVRFVQVGPEDYKATCGAKRKD